MYVCVCVCVCVALLPETHLKFQIITFIGLTNSREEKTLPATM
jgi:hypothetical protein